MNHFSIKSVASALLFSSFSAISANAAVNLNVNLGDSIRPVTHVATGSLYGFIEDLPADVDKDVAPLKPNAFLAPAYSGKGRQQPIGGAFLISPRLENTTAKVHVRLADVLPGWPYQFKDMDHWLGEVANVIGDRKAARVQNFDGYEIWNEPDGTWKNTSIDFNSGLWKKTYDYLRENDPKQRIIGPSYSWYNGNRMEEFVKYCSANNCMPDVISWHQWGSEGFAGSIEHYRSLEKKYNVTPRAISINEYSSDTHTLEGCPGVSVPFIAKFERHGVESAMISWWFTNLPGRLGSLLTANNERGGGWHLYKWYGDMAGYMAKVTPPNDKSDGVDGFAAVNAKKKEASIVLGGNTLGDVSVNIDGVPAFFGNKVSVSVEYVTWEDKDKAVPSTTPISTKDVDVVDGKITVPVNIANVYYAYRILLKAIVPQAPYTETAAAIPGKIEMENYDVGGEGSAYSDKDDENKGGEYRDDGVDVVKAGAGYAIGYTQEGEWLEYTVNVATAGKYKVSASVATASEGAGFNLFVDDKAAIENVIVDKGEDWETYSTIDVGSVELTAGEHVLKLSIVGNFVNIDWIQFVDEAAASADPAGSSSSVAEPAGTSAGSTGSDVASGNGIGADTSANGVANPNGAAATEAIYGTRYQVDFSAPRTYAVFGLNGKLLGRISAVSAREASVRARALAKNAPHYMRVVR